MGKLTATDVRKLGARLSNWGRWGDQDQLGTLNFIGPEQRAAATSLPRSGQAISLAIDFNADGPMPDRGRFNPRHIMTETGAGQNLPGGFQYADDIFEMSLQSATQWDALSHAFYDGQLYNGYASSTITSAGASLNSITAVRNGVVGRGVLLDVAGSRGVGSLPPGTAISAADLQKCADDQGVLISTGDIVLVRTGAVGQAVATGNWESSFVFGPSSGLALDCAEWLHDKQIAAVAADNVAVEVMPNDAEDCLMPLHMVCQRDMGLIFGEIWNLDELAVALRASGTYEFLLVAPPLPVSGAVGAPVNPIALL
jgi:kynurenine formamidase